MPGGAWNFGGSILTFLFPEILFVLVATALFVLFTKPEVVPGHWVGSVQRPVSYTSWPRPQEASAPPAAAAPAAEAVPVGAVPVEQAQPAAAADGGVAASADGGAAGGGAAGDGGAAEGGAAGTGDGA